MSWFRSLTILVAVVSGTVSLAWADNGQHPPPAFTEAEKRMIEEYILEHPDPQIPDAHGGQKAKGKKPLPPGIAKNLARGKPLPPGIAKHYLPEGLSAELPRRPGYERVIVDGRIILIEVATGIVRDILEDVLFPD
jgi:hypothetical protein